MEEVGVIVDKGEVLVDACFDEEVDVFCLETSEACAFDLEDLSFDGEPSDLVVLEGMVVVGTADDVALEVTSADFFEDDGDEVLVFAVEDMEDDCFDAEDVDVDFEEADKLLDVGLAEDELDDDEEEGFAAEDDATEEEEDDGNFSVTAEEGFALSFAFGGASFLGLASGLVALVSFAASEAELLTSFGAASLGAVSFGAASLGAVSFGAASLGAVSFGAASLGAVSFGAVSLGAGDAASFEAPGA